MQQLITLIIIFVVVGTLSKFMSDQSKGASKDHDSGDLVMRPTKFFHKFGIFIIGVVLVLWLILLFIDKDFSSGDFMAVSIVSFLLLLSSLYLMSFSNRYQVIIKKDGVVSQNSFGIKSEIKFNDIDRITFDRNISLKLSLRGKENKVSVYSYISGFGSLLDSIKSNVDKNIYRDAFKKIEELRKMRSDMIAK